MQIKTFPLLLRLGRGCFPRTLTFQKFLNSSGFFLFIGATGPTGGGEEDVIMILSRFMMMHSRDLEAQPGE